MEREESDSRLLIFVHYDVEFLQTFLNKTRWIENREEVSKTHEDSWAAEDGSFICFRKIV